MPNQSDKVKTFKLIDEEFNYLKQAASLIAICPHVVPSGIGIAQYFDELEKNAVSLQKYLYARAKERFDSSEWIEF